MTGGEYDFWVLDFDGTVVDIEQSYVHEVIDEVGDRLGRDFTDFEAELIWYGVGNAREQVLSGKCIDSETFWETFHRVEAPGPRADATYVYDDAEAFITSLDAPVGLVTHCQEYLTMPILSELDIHDWFDTVVCCSDETGWKPDPTPVELAMSDLGMGYNGHSGAMAGDRPHDVQAARNADLDAIHVSRHERNWAGDRVLGDRRVSTLTDLGV